MNNEELAKVKSALESGVDLAAAHAEQTHSAYAGYYPKRHEAVDRDVVDMREALAIIERATPAAASAGAAGTIDTPIKRYKPTWQSRVYDDDGNVDDFPEMGTAEHGDYVSYADHLHHVAAAVTEATRAGREYQRKVDEKIIERLRAATAPVSAAPTVPLEEAKLLREAWTDYSGQPAPRETSDEMFDFAAGFQRGRATLPQSAGAPVSAALQSVPGAVQQMANAGLDVTYGSAKVAPVSAAEPRNTWQGGYSGPAPVDAPIGTAKPGDVSTVPFAPMGQVQVKIIGRPADGQELPAPNHEEAAQLAAIKRGESNLARCYLDLATRQPRELSALPDLPRYTEWSNGAAIGFDISKTGRWVLFSDVQQAWVKRADLAMGQAQGDLTDAQIVAAMRPHLDKADGGFAWDTHPDHVATAGRAAMALGLPQGEVVVGHARVSSTSITSYVDPNIMQPGILVAGYYELVARPRAAKQAGKE